MNSTLWKNWKEVFSIDLRGLAFFRMGLAIVLLLDLLKRSQSLEAHYTDLGVLPLLALNKHTLGPHFLSFHTLSGSLEYQVVLFLLAGLLAFSLLIGFQTRWVTVLSWVLLNSLQQRNLLIEHTGDQLLRMLVFWGMFLPLGAKYSIDLIFRKNDSPLPSQFFSLASIAFLLQIFLLYFSSGILKWQHDAWQQGYALFVGVNLDIYTSRFANLLINQHGLLKLLTYASLFIETVLPFFLFIPWKIKTIRPLILLILLYFHIGIWMTFEMGHFQPLIVCAIICFLPTSFWNEVLGYLKFEPLIDRCQQWLKERIKPKRLFSFSLKEPRILSTLCGLLMAFMLLANIDTWVGPHHEIMPKGLASFGQWLRVQQNWALFADIEKVPTGWFFAWSSSQSGKQVNIIDPNEKLVLGKPEFFSESFATHRWRQYWLNTLPRKNNVFHPYFAQYLCRQKPLGEVLRSVHVRYFYETTRTDFTSTKPFMLPVFDHTCPKQ